MKDTYFFSHDYNARNDSKLQKLQMKHGMSGIGVFWCIVEMLYEEGGYIQSNKEEYERITFELRSNYDLIKSVIHDFDLFKFTDDNFYSDSIIDRLKKRIDKSKKAKESISKRWEKHKNTNVLQTNYDSNTIKERKGKERIEKESKVISDFDFDFFWNDYDKKIGDKEKIKKKWIGLKQEERDLIFLHIPKYKESQPDKKYRKNPETYLNNKSWLDEIIKQTPWRELNVVTHKIGPAEHAFKTNQEVKVLIDDYFKNVSDEQFSGY